MEVQKMNEKQYKERALKEIISLKEDIKKGTKDRITFKRSGTVMETYRQD